MNQPRTPHPNLREDNSSSAERPQPSEPSVAARRSDEDELPSLLRRVMTETVPPVDVLAGVQQKLRERSGGKFYADRWSTDRFPPVQTYLITSALMLSVVLVTYLVLRPLSGEPERAPAPSPVRIIAPR